MKKISNKPSLDYKIYENRKKEKQTKKNKTVKEK